MVKLMMRADRVRAGFVAMSALCGGAVLSGCESFTPPTLRVSEVVLAERSADAVVLNVTVEGENPNDIDLQLRDVTYRFEPEGGAAFSAVRSAEATLPRKGVGRFRVPVVLTGADAATASEAQYRFAGTVEYLLPGSIAELLFDSGLRRPTAGFGENGRLDLSKVQSGG